MGDLKKAVKICSSFQIMLGAFLILSAFLQFQGVELPELTPWQLMLIFFLNAEGCLFYLNKAFKRELKQISPETYNDMFGNDFINNAIRFRAFVYGSDTPSSHELRELKLSARRAGFMMRSIYPLQAPFWILIYFLQIFSP